MPPAVAGVMALRASILSPSALSACALRLRWLPVRISTVFSRSGQHARCEQAGLMSPISTGSSELFLNKLNGGIEFVLYFLKD